MKSYQNITDTSMNSDVADDNLWNIYRAQQMLADNQIYKYNWNISGL